jgi:AraC family transcriptional regulator, transcriptional activator of pobA
VRMNVYMHYLRKKEAMDFEEFVKNKPGCHSVEEGLAVWEVRNKDFLHDMVMSGVHIQLFVIDGYIKAEIDSKKVTLVSDSLTDILQGRMSLKVLEASDDISAIIIMLSEGFLANLINNKPPFPIEYVMQVMQWPVLLLTHEQSIVMRQRLDLLISFFKDETHYHQMEMLKCALWMVYMEMSNIFMHQKNDVRLVSETDRKRYLFMRFVKQLPLHVREERGVGFYASELCVSCQYLERIVKMISGQTASQWISRVLIGEVNHQLKETEKSMQQIADEFGFPDQASFTKYYKRNLKMTPSEYRSKNLL